MKKRVSKKVCLLGDYAVGKTSLVRRFVYDLFDDKYISTIGVKVSRKTLAVPYGGEPVELVMMLWDLAGSEEFDRVRASYVRGSAGALLVCDLTRPETLDSLPAYVDSLRAVSPKAQIIVVANKEDLTGRDSASLSLERLEGVAAGFQAPLYVTSAKTGAKVEDMFRHLGALLVA